MPSEEHYDSDYDTRPEAGRVKQHLDSDDSDNERSSGPRRPLPFLNDDADDDDDEAPTTLEPNNLRHDERSSSSPATASANPIRQPTAFAPPDPSTTPSGPTFYYNNNNKDKRGPHPVPAPVHAAATGVSADGTSMFCVEGYVNTPELSAGRGGGLSQGLPANGPYKSLFRARSRSASRGSGNNNNKASAAAAAAADAGLHVLAEAAQSPEALSPVSTASPAPTTAAIITTTITPTPPPAVITTTTTHAPTSVPTSKKRRKPSPLMAASSSPASSVAPLDSAVSALRPSPVASSNASVSSSYVVVDSRPPPRQPRAKPGGGGGSTTGKGKRKARVPPPAPPTAAQANGNGEGEQRYERRSSPRPHSGSPFSAVGLHHESEATVQGRSRNMQKNKTGSNDVALPPPPPAPADDGNYDHAQSYYYETELSGAGNTVREGGQSLSPPPPKIWASPRPTPTVVDQYPTSAGMTSKETSPAPVTDSRSQQTPSIKPRMVTLLIEDRRLATDELVEVHVPLRTIGEGYLWADAKDVCAALQSGPSRIDGPAMVFTMRVKYRQTFLRVSADGEDTTRSANLKVETDKTLPIVVEGISDPRAQSLGSNPSSLVSTGLVGPLANTADPMTPVSNHRDLDGVHTTPPDHKDVGLRSGVTRKRKREASLSHMQLSPFGSRKSRRGNPMSSLDAGYMSDTPPVVYRSQRVKPRDQTISGSRLDRSGYETDQPFPSAGRTHLSSRITAAQEQHQGSSDRRMSSLLQPPPTPMEASQRRMHDKVVSFLKDDFMEDTLHWNEFARDRAHVGSLSNVALLRIYWFAQGRLDTWVGSRLPKHLNYKKVETRHVLDALGVTEDWYRECNETLSLVIVYGERGQRYESPRVVAATRDRAPKSRVGSSGPTDLLVLLREAHEEYCERARASSVESM